MDTKGVVGDPTSSCPDLTPLVKNNELQQEVDLARAEQREADSFLSPSTNLHAADERIIRQILTDINDDTHIISTQACDLVRYNSKSPSRDWPKDMAKYAGTYLASLLEGRYQNIDPAIVQMTLQSLLLHRVYNAFENWISQDILDVCNELRRSGKGLT